jgi:short-subunit dehydrogenase
VFAEKGANVVLVARDEKKLAAALEYVKVSGRVHLKHTHKHQATSITNTKS